MAVEAVTEVRAVLVLGVDVVACCLLAAVTAVMDRARYSLVDASRTQTRPAAVAGAALELLPVEDASFFLLDGCLSVETLPTVALTEANIEPVAENGFLPDSEDFGFPEIILPFVASFVLDVAGPSPPLGATAVGLRLRERCAAACTKRLCATFVVP